MPADSPSLTPDLVFHLPNVLWENGKGAHGVAVTGLWGNSAGESCRRLASRAILFFITDTASSRHLSCLCGRKSDVSAYWREWILRSESGQSVSSLVWFLPVPGCPRTLMSLSDCTPGGEKQHRSLGLSDFGPGLLGGGCLAEAWGSLILTPWLDSNVLRCQKGSTGPPGRGQRDLQAEKGPCFLNL